MRVVLGRRVVGVTCVARSMGTVGVRRIIVGRGVSLRLGNVQVCELRSGVVVGGSCVLSIANCVMLKERLRVDHHHRQLHQYRLYLDRCRPRLDQRPLLPPSLPRSRQLRVSPTLLVHPAWIE